MALAFVLVEPAVAENVGAAARALKTMGFSDLRIVNSRCYLEKGARILAHGATDILDNARHYDCLEEALRDRDFILGTTAKPRHHREHLYTPEEARKQVILKADSAAAAALVFGCEESGLSNEHLEYCHLLTSVPLAASYPSINLGQAVMLYAYAFSALGGEDTASPAPGVSGQYRALREKVQGLLPGLGYDASSKLYRWAMDRIALANDKDVGFLHTLVDKVDGGVKGGRNEPGND